MLFLASFSIDGKMSNSKERLNKSGTCSESSLFRGIDISQCHSMALRHSSFLEDTWKINTSMVLIGIIITSTNQIN